MRFAFRSLRRRPVFAAAAILTVALGIGANAALFGIVYAVLLQPLPFRDPARLVEIWQTHPALPQLQATVPDFEDWRTQARSFDSIAAYTLSAMNNGTLLGQGDPEAVHATMAASELFSTMGIEPLAGRVFTGSEERAREHVALLSEVLWRRKFAADPAVVGRQIRMDSESFRVIGVVPQRQAFPAWADLWIPLSLIEPELRTRRKYHPLEVIAHLKPGVSEEQAQTEIQALAHRASEAHPDTNATIGAYVIPLAGAMTDAVRPPLLLAWAAVGLVLLMACANLAHLFLARLSERRQELAIRRALGAAPSRLIGQILAECFVVAAIGGAAGVLCAIWAGQLARRLAAGLIPRLDSAGFGAPVWVFAVAITLFAAVLFALPACWQVLRSAAPNAAGGRSVTRARSGLSAVLMAAEVAMALPVLSGAALLTRNFAALLNEDPGFRAQQVSVVPNIRLGRGWEQAPGFLANEVMPAIRAIPGVVDTAAVNSAPLSLGPPEFSRFATRFGVEGRVYDSGSYPVAQTRWVTPEYFRVLGIPLKRGRWLSDADRGQTRIIVNETLARRFFPKQDAVGKRLVLGVMDPQQEKDEIVGVVGDVREFGLDREVEPAFYTLGAGPSMTLVVKTAGATSDIAGGLRRAIRTVDPGMAVPAVRPLEQNVDESLARRRFTLILLAIFGGIAAFLTAAGIYGMMAQSVNARVREFGVRAAIGADPGELVRMILGESLALMLPGLLVGLALTLGFARVLKSFVYRASATDPISMAAAALFLIVLAVLSAWLPARRAATVDPASALRSE